VQYVADLLMCRHQLNGVVCTQPRRLAATSVAARVATEFGCNIGEQVGYQVGISGSKKGTTTSKRISGKTVIRFVTEGILINDFMKDRMLKKYSVIIVDEAHERTCDTDVILGMLKELLAERKDLRVIIMSASINVRTFCDYFDCDGKICVT
jgi:HrpA-like RNA helicase